eukprot:scaffold38182_cov35-Tisochrysis_lutea.AAC.4
MGPRIQPAIQVRQTIEKLIYGGVLSQDVVARWKARLDEEDEVKVTRSKAKAGDTTAMLQMAMWYQSGIKGLPRLSQQYFCWSKRASDAGNPRGMACAAECYLSGEGVEPNAVYGLHLMTLAAVRGSEAGAFCLGLWYSEGLYGLPINEEESKYWLTKVVGNCCIFSGLSAAARHVAKSILEELLMTTRPAVCEASDHDDMLDSCEDIQ